MPEKQKPGVARRRPPPPVVGIGASAGGVKAFQNLVRQIPPDAGIAWVLILHLAPDRHSELSAILARQAGVPVTEVTARTKVVANHIYVIAPGHTMTIREGALLPVHDDDPLSRRTSIDAFLLSLAKACGERAGCALLSGAGTDGTLGLKAVKEAGGLTLTQELGTAEHDSMLLSAVRTGLVDRELPVEEMPAEFARFLTRRRDAAQEEVGDDARLQICELMRRATGHDFSGYKPATVDRRVRRRMQLLGLSSLSRYLEWLQEDKAEATLLFRELLIGVTQFFRDPEGFAALSRLALPKILEGRTADDEIRVWIPGCSTGEEAYSLAMLLQEQVAGMDSAPEIRIFGSDIDENALHVARLGRYPRSIAADVSPERLARFFEAEDGTYCVRSQLREVCLFAQHNMLRDPPFSRIDLISCRNVLIYMNADLQRRLVPVFHYALRPSGFLSLGPAENAGQESKLFRERDRKHRIYQRIGEAGRLPDFPITPAAGGERRRGALRPLPAEAGDGIADRAMRRILSGFAPAYAVIDGECEILEISGGTGAFLELPSGRPRANLAAMARSGLAVEIKAAVARAAATGRSETRSGLTVGSGEQRRHISLVVEPMAGRARDEQLYLVVFQAAAPPAGKRTARQARPPEDEIARALELELQNTRERLQSTLEELETSNEELKASNEELSSVNEELHSSNEELETSKEELQSINEELRSVNNELNSRVEELSRANNDLKNLFANTQIAMLFLDESFRIMNFTPPAKPLFRLRDHDTGRPLDELAPRIDFAALKKEVQAVIRSGEPVEREVHANGGGTDEVFIMRILPYRTEEEVIRGAVLTFIDITERKHAEERLATMVSELNHRVKNTLAGVQAIMRQTERRSSSVAEFAELLQGRLQAMAAAHHLLADRAWERVGLRELVNSVLGAFADAGTGRLAVEGPEVQLRPGVAITLGMILHELGTNAAKHGAWSGAEGQVTLRWEQVQADGGSLRIAWDESGGAPARAPAERGFGLQFMEQAVGYELDGSCRIEFAPEGFRCRLELPLESVRARPPQAGTPGGGPAPA